MQETDGLKRDYSFVEVMVICQVGNRGTCACLTFVHHSADGQVKSEHLSRHFACLTSC